MAFAVVFYFDPISEAPLFDVWNALERASLSSPSQKGPIRPHLTLAIYDSINCAECENEIKHVSEKTGILSMQADHFGIFPGPTSVIFVAPPPNQKLMAFQTRIHQILENFVSGSWEMYQPENWVPHCTLAQDIQKESLPTAIDICMKLKLPHELRITKVGLVEFDPVIPLFDINLAAD